MKTSGRTGAIMRMAAMGLLLTATSVIGAAGSVCAPPPSATVSWYPGDGNASDIKGSNNGTLVNGAGFAAGEVGQGFSTDGVGSYVQIADSASLHPASLTVDTWINLRSIGSGFRSFVSKGLGSGVYDSFVLWMNNGSFNTSVSVADGNGITINSGITLSTNTWYHVAVTVDDATHAVTLYLNGQAVGTSTLGGSLGYDSTPVLIGADTSNGAPAEFTNGVIDEVHIMDRALSAAEIQGIYQAGTSGLCKAQSCATPPPGLAAWFKGDDSPGTVARDSQGANTGALVNGATFAPGMVGQAFHFDGSDDVVVVPDSAALRPRFESLAAWVKFDTLDSPGNAGGFPSRMLMTKRRNSSTTGQFESMSLVVSGASSNATFGVFMWTGSGAGSAASTTLVQPGVWYHVVGTYDEQNFKLYVNGVLEDTEPFTAPIEHDPSQPLYIGSNGTPDASQYHYPFAGLIDEAQMFSRALTAQEVATMYHAGANGLCLSCAALQGAPSAWYKGEGNASDSSGSGNNGSVLGGASFVPGIVGKAFSFNGTDAGVSVPASSSLNVGAGAGLSVDAWINPTNSGGSQQPLVEWNNGSTYGAHFWISVSSSSGCGIGGPGSVYANLVDTSGSSHPFCSAGGLLTDGAFQHVALTYDKASGLGTLYLNGAVVAQQNLGSFTPQTAYNVYAGVRPSGSEHYAGLIDEVQIFPRALSGAEINGLYCAGARGTCTGLVTANKTSMSFGNLGVGSTSAAQTVYLSNHGSSPIIVGTPAISGAGFAISANTCGATLNGSNTACSVSVTFAPTATGGASGSLSFSDGPDNLSPHIVTLSGNGVPQATASPGSLAFGNVAVGGTSAAQAVYLSNHQSGPMSLSAPSISGAGFAISATTCGASLSGSNSACSVSVTFTPGGSGAVSGTLTLSGSPDDQSPHVIALSGNGVAPVTVTSSSLSFGLVTVGHSSAAQTVYLSNHSSSPVSLGAPSISGSGFSISGTTCGATLNGSNTACAVSVTFTPTASGKASGTLTLTATPDGQSPHLISLSGAGN